MPELPEDTAAGPLGATKRCDYCGRKSDSSAAFCDGCGTTFAFPPPLPPLAVLGSSSLLPLTAKPPSLPLQTGLLDARAATTILLLTLAAQVLVAFAISFVAAFAAAFNLDAAGMAQARSATISIINRLMPVTLTAATLAGGVAFLTASLTWVPRALRDRSSVGAAWVPGSLRHLGGGLALGVLAALMLLGLLSIPALRPTHIHLGPLARMSNTPGWPRMLWFLLAVLFAPPTEELLFRGVVYGGYCRSFGPTKAAVLTTSIFWALHLPEMAGLPVGGVGIAAAAIAALWMRVRSSAVGPAIATHLGYNGTLALLHLLSTHPHA